jgi:CRISPR-associated protein Cas8a1/Csx13
MTWKLSDPGMDLLERAGLAALYLTLSAADEASEDLSPLEWEAADLSPEGVTLRWDGADRDAFERLLSFAWQVREGVLYFPAIHRDSAQRDHIVGRLGTHTGVLSTFLQHPRVQPKGELVTKVFDIDEGKQVELRYQSMEGQKLKPLSDLPDFFDRKGMLVRGEVSLSSWVVPGCAPRFRTEPHAWAGPASIGLLSMLAPIACFYMRLVMGGVNWIFVVPDVRDLAEYAEGVGVMELDPTFQDVASLGDAGLSFVAKYAPRGVQRHVPAGCRAIMMGKVGYYQSQSIRKGVIDVPFAPVPVARYRLLHGVMKNWYQPRAKLAPPVEEPGAAKKKARAKPSAKRAAVRPEGPQATAFLKVPTVRGPIADNLVAGRPWYDELCLPPPWEREALDAKRKLAPGQSIEALWFREVTYQRGKLRELVEAREMWDKPEEKTFVEAFWEALRGLFYLEAKGVERGGERQVQERHADLVEDIRRQLARAKTRELLRETLADLFSRAARAPKKQPTVKENSALIWNLMNDPHDWKRARDLALLALATYQGKSREQAPTTETADEGEGDDR